MCELENELLGVKSNLTKSNKSLQECHQLICNQTAVASRKLEEEQKSHDNEKFRLERELNEFKIRFITLEEEKGRIEKENSRSSQQNEDILKRDTERYTGCIDVEEVLVSPVILCRDSQEDVDNEMKLYTQVASSPVKRDIGIHYTQVTSDCEDISEKDVTSYALNTNQDQNSSIDSSPEPPNKRAKLDREISQNNSPTLTAD